MSQPLLVASDLSSPRSRSIWNETSVVIGMIAMGLLLLASLVLPFFYTVEPTHLVPTQRLKPPSAEHWFGTDAFGRDLMARVIHGGRISLMMGAMVALLAVSIGTVIGLVAGYFRIMDQLLMRFMDGVMVIPGILLAIALVAMWGASITTVAIAIVTPEVPRVARLLRGIVLSLREEAYVEAAISLGSRAPKILWLHILPNTIGPLIVQGTYVAASAVITESALSFLGVGISSEIPTWGNIIAEGRMYFRIAPWIIAFPGLFLAVMVLSINLLGDGLRDMLDPRSAKATGALR